MKYIIRFANYKGLTGAERIQVFSLLLTGVAADWFTTLTGPQTANWTAVEREFRTMFLRPAVLRYQEASNLWLNPQGATERVDVFVTRLKRAAANLNLPDDLLQMAVLNGLRSQIRTHCLTQGCQTLEETVQAARIAEASISADPVTDLLLQTLRSNAETVLKQQGDLKQIATKIASLEAAQKPSSAESDVSAVDNSKPKVDATRAAAVPRGTETRPTNWQGNRPRFNPRQQQKQLYGERQQDQQQQTQQQQFNTARVSPSDACYRCGLYHEQGAFCKGIGVTCFRCGKANHLARVCRSAPLTQQQQ